MNQVAFSIIGRSFIRILSDEWRDATCIVTPQCALRHIAAPGGRAICSRKVSRRRTLRAIVTDHHRRSACESASIVAPSQAGCVALLSFHTGFACGSPRATNSIALRAIRIISFSSRTLSSGSLGKEVAFVDASFGADSR